MVRHHIGWMSLLPLLLPDPTSVRLRSWHIDPAGPSVTVALQSRSCPVCGTTAKRTHSHYVRTLADLPWGEHAVAHRLRVRRMFCDNARCDRRIFTERLPGVAEPWARRTQRAAVTLPWSNGSIEGQINRLHMIIESGQL
jgi:transposase